MGYSKAFKILLFLCEILSTFEIVLEILKKKLLKELGREKKVDMILQRFVDRHIIMISKQNRVYKSRYTNPVERAILIRINNELKIK